MHDRLTKFIKSQSLNVSNFEIKIDVADGTIAKCLRNKTAITTTVLEKISENFPKLNIDWLITGKGTMLKGTKKNTKSLLEEEEEKYKQNDKALSPDNISFMEAVHKFLEAVDRIEDKNEQLYNIKSELLEANEKILALTEENRELKSRFKDNTL